MSRQECEDEVPAGRRRLGPHGAAVHLGEAARDREAEPGAAHRAVAAAKGSNTRSRSAGGTPGPWILDVEEQLRGGATRHERAPATRAARTSARCRAGSTSTRSICAASTCTGGASASSSVTTRSCRAEPVEGARATRSSAVQSSGAEPPRRCGAERGRAGCRRCGRAGRPDRSDARSSSTSSRRREPPPRRGVATAPDRRDRGGRRRDRCATPRAIRRETREVDRDVRRRQHGASSCVSLRGRTNDRVDSGLRSTRRPSASANSAARARGCSRARRAGRRARVARTPTTTPVTR